MQYLKVEEWRFVCIYWRLIRGLATPLSANMTFPSLVSKSVGGLYIFSGSFTLWSLRMAFIVRRTRDMRDKSGTKDKDTVVKVGLRGVVRFGRNKESS